MTTFDMWVRTREIEAQIENEIQNDPSLEYRAAIPDQIDVLVMEYEYWWSIIDALTGA